jgi:hypothetical protein
LLWPDLQEAHRQCTPECTNTFCIFAAHFLFLSPSSHPPDALILPGPGLLVSKSYEGVTKIVMVNTKRILFLGDLLLGESL